MLQRLATLAALALIALTPDAAYAQASITGIVRDTSGAVLPGVTVEAASPALIRRFDPRSATARDSIESKTCGRARIR
jgi:hypothetical protein